MLEAEATRIGSADDLLRRVVAKEPGRPRDTRYDRFKEARGDVNNKVLYLAPGNGFEVLTYNVDMPVVEVDSATICNSKRLTHERREVTSCNPAL